MYTLKSIKTKKQITISQNGTLKNALEVINSNKIGSVVIVEKNRAIGIITESDVINALEKKISLDSLAYKIAKKNLVTTDQNRPIDFAFDILSRYNIKRLILQSDDGKFQGLVLQEDLVRHLESDVYKVELKIKSIIDPNKKIIAVDYTTTLQETLSVMSKNKIGSILIKKRDEHVGIVTEKDIIDAVYNNTDSQNIIERYMSSPLIYVDDEYSVEKTIELMQLSNIRRVIIKNQQKKIVSIVTNRDILQYLKGNYTSLLQSRIKQAQEIMDLLPEPIIEVYYNNKKGIVSWANTIAKESFGENIIDIDIEKLLDRKSWEKIVENLLSGVITNEIIVDINHQTYELSGTVSTTVGSKYLKLIFKNVTSYQSKNKELQEIIDKEIDKRLESEYLLMQQAKLATMGEMIGHIAHQWRQPLAKLGGIFMNIESAYSFKELTKEYLQEKLSAGNKLIKYMSLTIDDFRNFFEPASKTKEFCINDQITSALNLIQASLVYRHITIDFQNDKEFYTYGYPNELSQVILNIVANAEDVIVARKVVDGVITITIDEDKGYNIIKIKDNGGGIKKEILPRIFDSYFTTKHRKEGSGLGLYMSKLIIETKLDGKIFVDNGNEGAVFTILLQRK